MREKVPPQRQGKERKKGEKGAKGGGKTDGKSGKAPPAGQLMVGLSATLTQ